MNPIPLKLLPACKMKRIILHWTCGRRASNTVDREHYNLLIEHPAGGAARVIGGDHPIDDNVSTGDGDYAAHTRGINTGSIGLALCGMMGCQERPFKPGPEPFTPEQWELMCEAAAQLCKRYVIAVTDKTVLAHGEVQKNLGVAQLGKWDPMRLPWEPGLQPSEVMKRTRARIAAYLAKL